MYFLRKDILKVMNISNLAQLPNLLEGAKSLVSLWVSDLDESKAKIVFDVTKTSSNFLRSGSVFVCSFCVHHWGNFFLISIIAKAIWATIVYSLNSVSSPLVDLL